jgi:E3 ubiquitin-protein ligase TRIP12
MRDSVSSGDSIMQDADVELSHENVVTEGDEVISESHEEGEYVRAPYGLFPRPWPATSEDTRYTKVISYYGLLGRTVAKALQDGRLLDLPLSTAFYKFILGQVLFVYC